MRTFPEYIEHPKFNKSISVVEFDSTKKDKVITGKSIIPGHKKTKVYFVDKETGFEYITEIILDTNTTYHIVTPCSFEPKFGIDAFDGSLIENAEHWILSEHFKVESPRIVQIFGDKDKILCEDYIRIMKIPFVKNETGTYSQQLPQQATPAKKWWKFW